ncbi:jg5049 [Pararge aegeria aegeria]|uniref:Jg5049 protein n=1 Tax=Pararge aegeria aegeria TaxID=348720 RepID=A0A8S4SBT1_9NEOP|nr:jg5049 [Pararge aegeria aegeria]
MALRFTFCINYVVIDVTVSVVAAGVRTVDVQAVEGMVAQFPCELGTAANDKVYMVFWFRDDAGIPLYREVLPRFLPQSRIVVAEQHCCSPVLGLVADVEAHEA